MTEQRRIAKLEASLTPTERVLAWLDEAHGFGGLDAYVDALLDAPPDAFPINRLAREAATATQASLRARPPQTIEEAVRKAVRATIFRFELVLRINVVAHELIEREKLLYALNAARLALLANEDREERRSDQGHLRRLAALRDVTASAGVELQTVQEARAIAERRYLDGRPALFPDDAHGWATIVRLAQEVAVMTEGLAELDGVAPSGPASAEVESTVTACVADLTEPSRVMALEKLDEERRGFTIAIDWLRSKRRGVIGDDAEETETEAGSL